MFCANTYIMYNKPILRFSVDYKKRNKAFLSSFVSIGLAKCSSIPTAIVCYISSCITAALSAIIGIFLLNSLIFLLASKPSITGICKSMSIKS